MATPTSTEVVSFAVFKSDLADPVAAGGNVRYTIRVQNTGLTPLTDLLVTDTLPAGTLYVSSNPTGSAIGDQVVWSAGALPAGGSLIFGLELSTQPTLFGEIVNVVMASSGGVNSGASETTLITMAGMPTPEHTATPTGTPSPTPTLPAAPGGINVLVWIDLDRNGLRDPFEPPLQGAQIDLFALGPQSAAPFRWHVSPLASCVTGQNGMCSFESLPPGIYRVVETSPPGRPSTTSDDVRVEVRPGQTVQATFGDAGYGVHLPVIRGAPGQTALPW